VPEPPGPVPEPIVWVVAGCLFEVSLPSGNWRGSGTHPEVTLLAEEHRETGHHFRFRAEVPGEVTLRFEGDGTRTVIVRIAPEHLTAI
jgi:hypothetical protein